METFHPLEDPVFTWLCAEWRVCKPPAMSDTFIQDIVMPAVNWSWGWHDVRIFWENLCVPIVLARKSEDLRTINIIQHLFVKICQACLPNEDRCAIFLADLPRSIDGDKAKRGEQVSNPTLEDSFLEVQPTLRLFIQSARHHKRIRLPSFTQKLR